MDNHPENPERSPAPDAPREAEVRAWLALKAQHDGNSPYARAALALLDAGRKDRERVDWIEQEIETGDITISGSAHGVTLDLGEGVPKSRERTVRAAIDQARGA